MHTCWQLRKENNGSITANEGFFLGVRKLTKLTRLHNMDKTLYCEVFGTEITEFPGIYSTCIGVSLQ